MGHFYSKIYSHKSMAVKSAQGKKHKYQKIFLLGAVQKSADATKTFFQDILAL